MPATISSKKERLTKLRVRILRALATTGKPMPRERINEICARQDKSFQTAINWPEWIGAYLGHLDPQINTKMATRRGPTLYGRKLLKILEIEEEIGHKVTLFQITPKGLSALKSLKTKK